MPTTSAGLFRDYLPAPQICKSFSAPPSFCETRPEHFDRALADGKVRCVGNFRGVAALLSVCVGGAGFEMRFSGAVRATGVKPLTRISLIVTNLFFWQAMESMRVNSCNSCLISAFRFPNFSFCRVTVPSLDDWEKEWEKNSQRNVQPKLLPVDFRSPLAVVAQSN
jgi:hypothetical protein